MEVVVFSNCCTMRDENAKMTSGVAATTSRAVSGIPLSLTATCEPQDDKILSLHVPEPTKFFKECSLALLR
jgi:hypothetical protein